MKIERKNTRTTCFANLELTDVFNASPTKTLYMKVEYNGGKNAVNLQTGEMVYFMNDVGVTRLNATLAVLNP